MESRKLIKFGGNSFVVSVPRKWVNQHQLKKGDLIFMEEESGRLILNLNNEEVKELKTAIVTIDGKPIGYIHTELTTLYLSGYDIIEIRGDSIEKRASKLKDFLKNFVGMELMEETTSKIIVKDLIDIKEVSTKTLIRRIDIIIRAMITDAIASFEADHYESINQRDNDVNRLAFLLRRIIRQATEKRTIAIKLGVSRLGLMKNHLIVGYLESIGDCTKRVARGAREKKIDKKCQARLTEIFSDYRNAYLDVMKAYHTNNIERAYKIEMESKKRLNLCEEFEKKYNKVPMIIYNLKSMTSSIKHIARAIMNFHVRRE